MHQGLYRAQGYLLNMRIITAAVWGPIIVGEHQENGMGKKNLIAGIKPQNEIGNQAFLEAS